MSKVSFLTLAFLKNILRQRSMIFSTLVLPALIMWSTWWVTADIPMQFGFAIADNEIGKSMIDVHVVTGALTSIAITSSLFGYILFAENRRTISRLRISGYTDSTISLATLLSLLVTLILSIVVVSILALNLTEIKDTTGMVISIVTVTAIYASLGTLVAKFITNVTEGTLILLIFSFLDLMLLTNPMGGGVYLEKWTYFLPGFWPVQIALESAFVGAPSQMAVVYPLVFITALVVLNLVIKPVSNGGDK